MALFILYLIQKKGKPDKSNGRSENLVQFDRKIQVYQFGLTVKSNFRFLNHERGSFFPIFSFNSIVPLFKILHTIFILSTQIINYPSKSKTHYLHTSIPQKFTNFFHQQLKIPKNLKPWYLFLSPPFYTMSRSKRAGKRFKSTVRWPPPPSLDEEFDMELEVLANLFENSQF